MIGERFFYWFNAIWQEKRTLFCRNNALERWEWFIHFFLGTVAAIAGAFLLILQMIYFKKKKENSSGTVISVFFNMGRDLIFIILGVEVLTWYKLALDRIKGELEKSVAEG